MIDPETKMGPVTLRVRDLTEMTQFYEQVIGLDVRDAGDSEIELGTAVRPLVRLHRLENGRSHPRRTGLYHLALRVPSRRDLANWLHQYVRLQTPHWQGASDHGFSEALYFTDPEGNGIEIYCDRPQQEWQVLENGQLPAIVAPLDLEQLLHEADPDAPWHGIPVQTDMGHVHLKVSSIAKSRHFYHDLLGFAIMTNFRDSALFVAAGGYHHHLGLNVWHSRAADPLPEDGFGLDTVTILFATDEARAATIEQLQNSDWPLEVTNGEVTVRDPAGIKLRLESVIQ